MTSGTKPLVDFDHADVLIAAKAIHQWQMGYVGAEPDDRYWDWEKLKPPSHQTYIAMARAALYAVEEGREHPEPPQPVTARVPSAEARERFIQRIRWQ